MIFDRIRLGQAPSSGELEAAQARVEAAAREYQDAQADYATVYDRITSSSSSPTEFGINPEISASYTRLWNAAEAYERAVSELDVLRMRQAVALRVAAIRAQPRPAAPLPAKGIFRTQLRPSVPTPSGSCPEGQWWDGRQCRPRIPTVTSGFSPLAFPGAGGVPFEMGGAWLGQVPLVIRS